MAKAKAAPGHRPHVADISPETEWYMQTRGFRPSTAQPKFRTPEPRNVKGAEFHPDRVDRVIKALRCMRHVSGRWKGQPFEPEPWQVELLCAVFGWVKKDPDTGNWVRAVRSLYLDVPRKNGKSFLSSALSLYAAFADGEGGAQVLLAAASRDQAKNVFGPCALITKHSPELKAAGVRALRNRIQRDSDMSFIETVSSAADLIHGSSPHAAVLDELHVHRNSEVVDAVESGTGARQNPLIMTLTTCDDGRPGTVYDNKRTYAEKLAKRVLKDPSTFAVIYGADDEDDPFAEETWRKANPNYGVSVGSEFMRSEAAKAQQNPVQRARFLRLHLGLRSNEESRFIELPVWRRNAGLVVEEKLKGRRAFGGLDLASTSDLTALCWIFPDEAGGFDVIWRHWVPERGFERLNERTAGAAAVWRANGLITVTGGDVVDYEWVQNQIGKDLEAFDVQAIGYDPWNASSLVTDLTNDGAPMIQIRQGFGSLSAPLKQVNHLLLSGTAREPKLRHGGNALMEWQIDNLAVAMDPSGNVKPDRKRASDKIDGVAALVDAMAMAMAEPAEAAFVSAYESRSVDFI